MVTDIVTTSPPRTEVLRRIRAAKGGISDGEAVRVAWEKVAREYRRSASLERGAVIDLLEDRLRDYDAHVVWIGREDVAGQVASMLEARGKRRMVIPAGLAAEWLPVGFEFVVDEGMTSVELNGFDG